MTSPDAPARPASPATSNRWRGGGVTVGLAAVPPTRPTRAGMPRPLSLNASAAKLPTLRMLAAAILFAPALAFAQPPDTSTAPAPAAQEPSSTPRRAGETTTGRPPAPAEPAPATVPAAAAPPTAPLPGDAAGVTTAPSTTTTAPNPGASATATPRVSLPASASVNTPGSAGSLMQTILALALVLGLLVGMAWFLKRFGPRPGIGGANLRVVGALNLGGRERIMVVEVGDQWIVVGAAPGRVNALHTMPRQEGELAPAAGQGGIPATSFPDWLKKTIDKRNAT